MHTGRHLRRARPRPAGPAHATRLPRAVAAARVSTGRCDTAPRPRRRPRPAATKSWPSTRAPGRAANSMPGLQRAAVGGHAGKAPAPRLVGGGYIPAPRAASSRVMRIMPPPPARPARWPRRCKGCFWPAISCQFSWPLPAISTMSPGPASCNAPREWRWRGPAPRGPVPGASMPRSTSLMMELTDSKRGLSLVTTSSSASDSATAPCARACRGRGCRRSRTRRSAGR